VTPGRLREQLRVYAELRRAVGIPLGRNVLVLGDFVDYVDQHCDADPVTTQLALDWVDDWSGKHKLAYPGTLLTIVRQFLMYVSSAIEGTEVPDIGLLGAKKRGKPFVFTADEIAAMMQTAELFGSPGSFFPVTLKAIPGLMASTGLRVSEALNLNREHVMPRTNPGDLRILESKFCKSRLVPLHPTTAKQLAIYAGHRELLGYSRITPAFFVTGHGSRLSHTTLLKAFRKIMDQLGLECRGGSKRPTLHSLRHSFAVNRLRTWHEQNIDVRTRLPHLATYLGRMSIFAKRTGICQRRQNCWPRPVGDLRTVSSKGGTNERIDCLPFARPVFLRATPRRAQARQSEDSDRVPGHIPVAA